MVQTTLLIVGNSDKSRAIEELPIRLVLLDSGIQAIQFLKQEKIDALVSHWELIDIPDGKLLENVIGASPAIPTIALIEPGNFEQEIKAARLGVTAIVSDDIDDDYFRQLVSQLLGIKEMAAVRASSNY